ATTRARLALGVRIALNADAAAFITVVVRRCAVHLLHAAAQAAMAGRVAGGAQSAVSGHLAFHAAVLRAVAAVSGLLGTVLVHDAFKAAAYGDVTMQRRESAILVAATG